jgi:hypothetical protein
MIVAAKMPPTHPTWAPKFEETSSLSNAHDTLTRMTNALAVCRQGPLPQSDMIALWRNSAPQLALPEKFGEVLGNLLDRIEASALFSEESCSFSQKDLFASLQLWADKARLRLSSQGAAQL